MSAVLQLPKNDKGRDFIVADIHGCYEQLEKALVAVAFDAARDRLIAIGDLVSRGPASSQCLSYLSQPWFFALRGNHEDMFMRAVGNDGAVDATVFDDELPDFLQWVLGEAPETLLDIKAAFKNLPSVIELETVRGLTGLVHADVPEGMDWQTFKVKIAARDPHSLRVSRWSQRRLMEEDARGVAGVDRVFFGHSVVEGPRKIGNCFFIDTGGVFAVTKKSPADLYLSLVDLAASDSEILTPQKTADGMVRVVKAGSDIARNPPVPDQKLRGFKPS